VKLEEFLGCWSKLHPKSDSVLDGGEPRFYPSQGSYYVQVNCPYCQKAGKSPDTHHHCYVHYELGWFKCFRCNQHGTVDYLLGRSKKKLKKDPAQAWTTYTSTPESRVSDPRLLNRARGLETSKVKPGATVTLDSIPKSHPAWQYLLSEGFNAEEISALSEKYGIYYCIQGKQFTSNPENSTTGRLIWEIREGGELYGWQARWVPSHWPPTKEDNELEARIDKYIISPGLRKSFILYNWDFAQAWDAWVLVEGAKKVWKAGEFALASFGISNNPRVPADLQGQGLDQYWSMRLKKGNRPVIILYDRDGFSTAQSHEKALREMGVNAKAVSLPENGPNDLDNSSTFEIRQLIKTHLGRLPRLIK
jgi:hypothetical protein